MQKLILRVITDSKETDELNINKCMKTKGIN